MNASSKTFLKLNLYKLKLPFITGFTNTFITRSVCTMKDFLRIKLDISVKSVLYLIIRALHQGWRTDESS